MKDSRYQIKPASVIVFWVVVTLFMYPAMILAVGAVSLPFVFIVNAIEVNSVWQIMLGLIILPIWGAVAGSVIGRCQRFVLREKLYWAADSWVKWTVIGSAIGASVAFLSSQLTAPLFRPTYDGILLGYPFVLYLTILSAVQMASLRDAVQKSWWWMIAHLVSGIVMIGIIANNTPDFSSNVYTINIILIPIMAAFAQATITGFMLLHLFEKHMHDMEPENADELSEEKPSSVWDSAI